MKKLFFLLFAVVVAVTANAQLFNIGGVGVGYFYLGPKLGSNASFNTIEVASGVNKELKLGYQFGAVAKLGITDKLSIQPELIYTNKGYKANTPSFDQTSKSNFKYLGLPVIIKYAFIAVKGVDIYGSGGIYNDYMTGGKEVVTFGTNDFNEEFEITDFAPYNRYEFGFSAGGGANIEMKNDDKLNVDLRCAFAVTDVLDGNTTTSSKNITIQLSAIYLFDMTRWISFGGSKKDKPGESESQGGGIEGGSKVE